MRAHPPQTHSIRFHGLPQRHGQAMPKRKDEWDSTNRPKCCLDRTKIRNFAATKMDSSLWLVNVNQLPSPPQSIRPDRRVFLGQKRARKRGHSTYSGLFGWARGPNESSRPRGLSICQIRGSTSALGGINADGSRFRGVAQKSVFRGRPREWKACASPICRDTFFCHASPRNDRPHL